MRSDADLAAKLARLAQAEATDVVRPAAQATGTDTVLSASGGRCSLTTAGPNFRVVGSLAVVPGDLVLFTRRGTDRLVIAVLGRNAVDIVAAGGMFNPLTTFGQIIVAGADGAPSVIEPPADPTLDWALQWDGDLQRPVWVELP